MVFVCVMTIYCSYKRVCEGDFLQTGFKSWRQRGVRPAVSRAKLVHQIESGDHSQFPSHLLLLLQSFDFERPKAQNHVIRVSMTLKLFKKSMMFYGLFLQRSAYASKKEHRDEEHRDGKLLCGKGLRVRERGRNDAGGEVIV